METQELDVRSLETRRLRALVAADIPTASDLHDEDYQLISPFGDTWTKAEYLGGIESGELDYRVFEPDSEIRVLSIGDGAVVRYIARIEIHAAGRQDGGRFWHTDVWRLRDGRWRVVWSQATRIEPD